MVPPHPSIKGELMAKYYKVVRLSGTGGGALQSVVPCDGGRLYYSRRRFTKMIPGSMGIFVFKDQHYANQFAKAHAQSGGCLKVFSCEIKGKAEKTTYVQDIARSIKSFVKIFKGDRTRRKRISRIADMWWDRRVKRFKAAPQGTFTVQAVRIKRELRSFGYTWGH